MTPAPIHNTPRVRSHADPSRRAELAIAATMPAALAAALLVANLLGGSIALGLLLVGGGLVASLLATVYWRRLFGTRTSLGASIEIDALHHVGGAWAETREGPSTSHRLLDEARALTRMARTQEEAGEIETARHSHLRSLELRKREPANAASIAVGLNNLAVVERALGSPHKAASLLEDAVKVEEEAFGSSDLRLVATLTNLGHARSDLGEIAAAADLYQRALELQQAQADLADPASAALTTRLCSHLAAVRAAQGNYRDALSLGDEALEAARQIGDPELLGQVANTTGTVAYRAGKLGQAARIFEGLLPKARAGTLDPRLAAAIFINLGLIRRAAGQFTEARQMMEMGLAREIETLGPNHLEVLKSEGNLGAVLLDMGKWDEAERVLSHVLTRLSEHEGTDPETVVRALIGIAGAARSSGEPGRAVEWLNEALLMTARTEQPRLSVSVRAALGNAFRDQGELEQAAYQAEAALAQLRELGVDTATARQLNNVALIHVARGDTQAATRLLAEAVSLEGRTLGGKHPEYARAIANLGAVLAIAGEWDSAGKEMRKAWRLIKRRREDDDYRLAIGVALAQIHAGRGNILRARWLISSLEDDLAKLDPDHQDVVRARTLVELLNQHRPLSRAGTALAARAREEVNLRLLDFAIDFR